MEIHPTAVVSSGADLADDVVIKAFTVIGPYVSLGSGSVVGPHAIIDGWTEIGARNQIHPFVSIGYPPQDLSYKDEKTQVIIGDDNVFREGVTVHRGTQRGKKITSIGHHNYFMAYAHVAHDCVVGSHVIMANAATLGGHVHIEDHVTVGGLTAVHQFVRIGTYAFVGGVSGVRMDLPPYTLAAGNPTRLYGPNIIGLRRAGFSREAILALKKSYRILFRSPLTIKEAVMKVREMVEPVPEVDRLLEFMEGHSRRGITRMGHDSTEI